MKFNYKELTDENFESVLALVNTVFPYEIESENAPKEGYRSFLYPQETKDYWEKWRTDFLKYWTVYDNEHNLIGTTGLYSLKPEPAVSLLGWFCVDPKFRGKGYGEEILLWTIDRAKELGFTTLRLYTSSNENEKVAQNLYEKLGFKIVEIDNERDIIFREKSLI